MIELLKGWDNTVERHLVMRRDYQCWHSSLDAEEVESELLASDDTLCEHQCDELEEWELQNGWCHWTWTGHEERVVERTRLPFLLWDTPMRHLPLAHQNWEMVY